MGMRPLKGLGGGRVWWYVSATKPSTQYAAVLSDSRYRSQSHYFLVQIFMCTGPCRYLMVIRRIGPTYHADGKRAYRNTLVGGCGMHVWAYGCMEGRFAPLCCTGLLPLRSRCPKRKEIQEESNKEENVENECIKERYNMNV